jgi:hypothetical protein
MSARLATPPDAITGMRAVSAISSMRAASTPACAPSRSMSVTIAAATPAVRNRCATSATVSWLVSTHPLTASLPSRMSIEPKIFPGNSPQASRTSPGLSLDRAKSAANVERAFHRGTNLRDRSSISRCAGNRAIEIDYVDKFCTRFLEAARRLGRVGAIDGGPVHVAAEQAHDLAALQVNCGNDGKLLEQAS